MRINILLLTLIKLPTLSTVFEILQGDECSHLRPDPLKDVHNCCLVMVLNVGIVKKQKRRP